MEPDLHDDPSVPDLVSDPVPDSGGVPGPVIGSAPSGHRVRPPGDDTFVPPDEKSPPPPGPGDETFLPPEDE